MRRLLVAALMSSALTGCAATQHAAAPVETAAAVPPVPAAPPAPKPTFGTYGFDTAGMDASVAPGDDFYSFANGGWNKNTEIPADKSRYGMFSVLDDLSKQRTKGILDEAQKDSSSKIGNAYAAYLDQSTVEAKGLSPIKPWLDRIKSVKTKAEFATLAGEAARNGVGSPFAGSVGQDDKNPDVYIFGMYQSGLGLPDRDYYLQDTDSMKKARAAYLDHMTKLFAIAGEPNGAERAKAILALETAFAKVHWTRVDSRDADKTYNKLTLPAFSKMAPGFDFVAYLKARGVGQVRELLIAQPSALKGEAAIIAKAPLAALKDAMLVRSLDSFSDYLPDSVANETFAFYGTALNGTPQREPRWKRAVSFVSDALGEEVGKSYVAEYFPPETKAAADQLVKNVIAAMGRRIDGLDWMSPEAKVRAHEKLAAFTPKIGYPSKWRDYTGLDIQRGDLFGDALRSRQFDSDYNSNKLGKDIYRWEWGMTPMEINAYANFGMVEIVFPAAILQPPFFDPNADPAVNYGGIGAVIGHELSHHFDDQGAKYDAHGRLAQWWTDADVSRFKALTEKLAAQFDGYEPFPGVHVQGKLTLGENIADLAGLTVAHDAYEASLGGKPAPVIDGTTGDQRFYFGWAQAWRNKAREAAARRLLVVDPHSPPEYRVDTTRNLDPWYEAFKPKPTDKLYLKPEDRVRIW